MNDDADVTPSELNQLAEQLAKDDHASTARETELDRIGGPVNCSSRYSAGVVLVSEIQRFNAKLPQGHLQDVYRPFSRRTTSG